MARRTRVVRLLLCAASVLVITALAGAAEEPQTGDSKFQSVPITTVDGVELVGTYFRGKAGRDTPCVLMIHKLGSDSSKSDWVKLAQDITNNLGFAVLTFDLRGHGKSTT